MYKTTLEDGYEILIQLIGKSLYEIEKWSGLDYTESRMDKGSFGRYLEKVVGVLHSSNLLDFPNGELKAARGRVLHSGIWVPSETMAITQSTGLFSGKMEILENTGFFKKIERTLIVGFSLENRFTIRVVNIHELKKTRKC